MNFWDWINKDWGENKTGYLKRILAIFVVFLLVPILMYLVVTWDPVIGFDEEGDPVRLGLYIMIGFYWVGAYFMYKRHQTKRRLNKLLDMMLSEDDKEIEHLYNMLKRRLELLRKNELSREKGEDRVRWFGID